MIFLDIDFDKCDNCKRCEVFLPYLVERVKQMPIPVNPNNDHANYKGIVRAYARCPQKAIMLNEVESEN